ncbi:MAG: DNA-processing protein DprA [Gammaproteobacteria bacterium]|nr:DNA-processing protein DprA [Gammaproteobacteria bacterium]
MGARLSCPARRIADPPPLLFIRGRSEVLTEPQIAIVGSRKMTATGRRIAGQLAGDLARSGLIVTSGMAIGIDSAAHQGALDSGTETVAVLGCGCDRGYPPRHLLTCRGNRGGRGPHLQFPGSEPWPAQFPRRNRIVTGMTLGTIVVEAALRSGTLISARLAAEQGREVFAVPGSVYGSQSEGCHFLIKTGARLVDRAADVLDDLPGFERFANAGPGLKLPWPRVKPKLIIDMLARERATIDDLARSLSIPVSELLPLLIDLEIAGIVQSTQTGYEVRFA